MKLFRSLLVVAAGALVAPVCGAQGGPVFELQPGMTVYDFVSAGEEVPTNTAFSLKFSTRFPTRLKWLTPVIGGVFHPYGSTEQTIKNTDAPTLFVGNIFPLLSSRRTSGWLSVEVPVLLTHSPGASPRGGARDYGRDLVVASTVYLHIGARALREFGVIWSRLNLFAQLEQNVTPNKNPSASGRRDYFNPVASFGLSLVIGAPSD